MPGCKGATLEGYYWGKRLRKTLGLIRSIAIKVLPYASGNGAHPVVDTNYPERLLVSTGFPVGSFFIVT